MSYIALILSALIGVVLTYIIKPKTNVIQLLLAFSGAYLLATTVLHLIPEVFNTNTQHIGLYILIGILIQTVLEFFSKGAEHGHIHHSSSSNHIPWLLFISLGIHAFLEGLPLKNTHDNDLLWAIVIHKIPIVIILATFLRYSNISKLKAALSLIVFAAMSPLGHYFGQYNSLLSAHSNEFQAIIIGIFLHVSNAILFESTQNHNFNARKFVAIILGFSIAFISSLPIH